LCGCGGTIRVRGVREWAARKESLETGRRVARTLGEHSLLSLQRTAGNRAVGALLARRVTAGTGARELLPEEDELGPRAASFQMPGGVRPDYGLPANPGPEAFAGGQDLHFAPGRFNPDEEFLGHDLAHVAQARRGRVGF
jgi:hypothetical protein